MLRKVLLVCLVCSLPNLRCAAEELISWHDDIHEARQLSQQYKVPILLHFYGDQCLPCKTLEKNVFSRPEVASTMQRYFVPVRINATQDRRTAAEYGVHSWPTDVFVSPDGKILAQGVCNQSPNNYLQNLQSVAVMNRDRNAMLAGNSQPTARTADANSSYGRTASNSLQQLPPGRDQAPSPYTNPASGASPYADQAPQTALANVGQSNMPSPTWSGQSAHGQATSGVIGGGPLPNANAMIVHPSDPAMSQAHKDANLPPTVQWQTGSPVASGFAQSSNALPSGRVPASTPAHAGLALAPTIPASSGFPAPSPAAPRAAFAPPHDAIVENPHFAPAGTDRGQHEQQLASTSPRSQFEAREQTTQSNPTTQSTQPDEPTFQPASNSRVPAQLTASKSNAASASGAEQKPSASVPALSGFCPIALFAQGQWVEGRPDQAVRHRGRIYFLSSPEAVKQFLATPDDYCPVLSGYDPLIFLSQGRLVEGSVYDGLKDPKQNQILLFSTAENKTFFQENYERLAAELTAVLSPSQPLTASAPNMSVTR